MGKHMTRLQDSGLRRLPLAVIVVAALLGALFLREHLSFAALAEHRETLTDFRDAHYAWAALGFVLAYVAVVAFSLPGGTLATLTGGFLFGLFPGALFNVVGATVGAVALFLAVRAGLGDQMAARIDAREGRVRRLKTALEDNAFSALLTVRLIPAVPFFLANLVPALIGMRLAPYVSATFLGIIPGGVIMTWVGAGLGDVLERGDTPDTSILLQWNVLGPLLALSVLVALPFAIQLVRTRPWAG